MSRVEKLKEGKLSGFERWSEKTIMKIVYNGSGMPIEKGLRPTSPVHVHVDDDIPVHVHVKQKTKKGTKKVVSSAANVRGKSGKRSVSAKSRSKSPSGPWVPAPGRATKGQKLPWQGPTERVEIPTQDLSTDEEEVVHGQMRNYERKIETLMSEMGSLKNEVLALL
ncbi:hypothetical protein FSP39_017717 [Pinctada imbricata]|uniref:Uncharacterized protein n=1 Tax=Pinctada imbricata TaxID=66713 RepID=A0AA88XPX6_PINIB|nr:hypothetical protein FSP39_017717 [Pinctada imbricata]